MESNIALRRSLQSSPSPRPIIVLFLACLMTTEAFGQASQAPEAQISNRPPEAEVGARGQQMPRNITYSPWQKICFKDSLAKVVCRTTTNGTWDTGQTAVRVDLIEREGDQATRLQIFLPVGLYLQAGVKMTIDDGPAVYFPYSWCLTNICVAGNLIEPHRLNEIEAGQKLTLEAVNSNLVTLQTTISLRTFAAAHKGAAVKTLELPASDE